MAFKSQPQGESNVDWDAMNQHVVDAAGTQKKKKSLVGVISSIIDLGTQPQEDAKVEFTGSPAEEVKILAEAKEKGQTTYFETLMDYGSKPPAEKRYKRWKQKAQPAMAITVDFPQIMVDKAKFFKEGESDPRPLRLILNGEFNPKGSKEKILGRTYALSWTKFDCGTWSLKKNSMPYKLAVAMDVIEDGSPLVPEQIPQLLGKAALFEIQVSINEQGDRKFMNEKIKYASTLPEGMPVPELDEKYQSLVQFGEENDPEALKQLRVSVKNTMKLATEWETDVIKTQLEALKPTQNESSSSGDSNPQGTAEKAAPAAENKAESKDDEPDFSAFDDEIPF